MADDHGVIAAALTPRGKRGDLDFGAAFELIDLLCANRLQGVAFFTAAGEYPAFGIDERTRLVYLAAKRSRIPEFIKAARTIRKHRDGITAAIPPMAWAPRRWQVRTSSSV